MSNPINGLCDSFNDMIGRISQTMVKERIIKEPVQRPLKEFDGNEGLFSAISKGVENIGITAENMINTTAKTLDLDYQMEKAFIAHNIKATIYNLGTLAAIAGVFTAIFVNPIAGVAILAVSIAGRVFVDRAMARTWWGAVGNHHQVTDNSIYSLMFKSYLRRPIF